MILTINLNSQITGKFYGDNEVLTVTQTDKNFTLVFSGNAPHKEARMTFRVISFDGFKLKLYTPGGKSIIYIEYGEGHIIQLLWPGVVYTQRNRYKWFVQT